MQIWKQDAPYKHNMEQVIYHSYDGGILSFRVQKNYPVVYFKNDPNKDQEYKSIIKSVLTGAEFHDIGWEYVDTVMLDDGAFVVHYYKKV